MSNNVINFNEIREEKQRPKDLLTFEEVEKLYKIKYHTLYKYTVRKNEIPYIKKGGLKVQEKDIISWLNSGRVPVGGKL